MLSLSTVPSNSNWSWEILFESPHQYSTIYSIFKLKGHCFRTSTLEQTNEHLTVDIKFPLNHSGVRQVKNCYALANASTASRSWILVPERLQRWKRPWLALPAATAPGRRGSGLLYLTRYGHTYSDMMDKTNTVVEKGIVCSWALSGREEAYCAGRLFKSG